MTELRLRSPGVLDGALQEISDNDGLWTSLYIGAQSFRYAVTKSPPAHDQAWRSMKALLRLESLTGLSGFPARVEPAPYGYLPDRLRHSRARRMSCPQGAGGGVVPETLNA